jgi:hypothetical protein
MWIGLVRPLTVWHQHARAARAAQLADLGAVHAPVDIDVEIACRRLFSQSAVEVGLLAWLDGTPSLGNEIAYATVLELCDGLMEEFWPRI